MSTSTGLSFAQGSPGAAPSTAQDSDGRSTAFRSVEGGNTMQSGEKLLVEAYAAIWALLFVMLLLSWRRQKRIDQRIEGLERAIATARRENSPSPAAKAVSRSAPVKAAPAPAAEATEGES